jgi:hypothetical protein
MEAFLKTFQKIAAYLIKHKGYPNEELFVAVFSCFLNTQVFNPSVTLDEIRCSSARRVRKSRLAFQQT